MWSISRREFLVPMEWILSVTLRKNLVPDIAAIIRTSICFFAPVVGWNDNMNLKMKFNLLPDTTAIIRASDFLVHGRQKTTCFENCPKNFFACGGHKTTCFQFVFLEIIPEWIFRFSFVPTRQTLKNNVECFFFRRYTKNFHYFPLYIKKPFYR